MKTEHIQALIKSFTDNGYCRIEDQNKGSLLYAPTSQTKRPKSAMYEACRKHNITDPEQVDAVWYGLPLIAGTTFKPTPERFVEIDLFETRLNTYSPYIPNSTSMDCQPFLELLERLLPDPSERQYFTQWLAHLIQRPEERPSVAVMLTSAEGTGKGVLFNHILTPLLNNQVKQCATYDEFMGKHSTALADTMLVMLDDVKSSSDATITKMKSRISEPTITIERKFEQPYTQKCYSRVMLASNELRPLKLSKSDTRRWFAPTYIDHRVSKEETQQFCSSLINWVELNPQAIASIHNYLNQVDLTSFNPFHVEPTQTLLEMTELSVSYLEGLIQEAVEELKVFTLEDLRTHTPQVVDKEDIVKSMLIKYAKNGSNVIDPETGSKTRKYWRITGMTEREATEHLCSNPRSPIPAEAPASATIH